MRVGLLADIHEAVEQLRAAVLGRSPRPSPYLYSLFIAPHVPPFVGVGDDGKNRRSSISKPYAVWLNRDSAKKWRFPPSL